MRRVTKKTTRKAPPRRRAPRRMPPRTVMMLGGGGSLLAMTLGGWLFWPTEWLTAQQATLEADALAFSAEIGLRIDRVTVEGRHETPAEVLIAAVEHEVGEPILAVDANALRLRLEELPWIRRAMVERLLPGEIRLTIEERVPMALWQREGRYHLVDRYGDTMPVADVSKYAGMIVLTGTDAPANAQALLALLALEPELGARVVAAQRVGARRWNLRLDNGVDIRLPEEEAASAWRALADLERDEGLLDRDLVMIDLRTPDRLVVRLSPAAAELRRTPGDDT
ncbi:MAG: FtsQ-type POTRA domain-containing protein [Rhodospirillaceae bacterium]|nr:FtsQ-type POTRA domain-containing protein [Rhodospirillaceae bacterium]